MPNPIPCICTITNRSSHKIKPNNYAKPNSLHLHIYIKCKASNKAIKALKLTVNKLLEFIEFRNSKRNNTIPY
jgi:hypothetical protein